jgi:hypothetical protein
MNPQLELKSQKLKFQEIAVVAVVVVVVVERPQ